MTTVSDKKIKVTLKKSPIGRLPSHKASVRGLGLRKLHQSVTLVSTPEVLGMINRVADMVTVEEV